MDDTLSKFRPLALRLFRIITGLLLFQYGFANRRRLRRVGGIFGMEFHPGAVDLHLGNIVYGLFRGDRLFRSVVFDAVGSDATG